MIAIINIILFSIFRFSNAPTDTIFKAHKLILAACSKKFHDLFGTAPSNGSNVCVILEATTADNMSALLEFMYKGEVHVSQESLSDFLKAAESLQVNVVLYFAKKTQKSFWKIELKLTTKI